MKHKICLFTENYYKGGLDTFLINLFNTWPNPQDELTLLCNRTHPGLETIIEQTVRPVTITGYHRVFTSGFAQGQGDSRIIGSLPVRAFILLAFHMLQYPLLFPWYVLTLTFFFRRADFDRLLVVNGGYPASLLCRSASIAWRLSGKRIHATFNFHNLAAKPRWYEKLPEYIIDLAVAWSARQIVSVSRNCLDSLRCRKAFLDGHRLLYIYNGIEDPRSRTDQARDRGCKDAAPRYCVMLSTYEQRKGHAYLLRAFALVTKVFPDVQLRIYGYGKPREKQRVTDEVDRLNLGGCVTLNNFTPYTAQLIAKASVLVMPSQSYESFGLGIIEAMALGTPVVTTDVGGMPEVLGNSNAGFICSKDDPTAFADAIKLILADSRLAAELGQNGRREFEKRFTARIMSLQYEALVKDVSEAYV